MATVILDTGDLSLGLQKKQCFASSCHPIKTGIPFARKRRRSRNGSRGVRPCVCPKVTQGKGPSPRGWQGVAGTGEWMGRGAWRMPQRLRPGFWARA